MSGGLEDVLGLTPSSSVISSKKHRHMKRLREKEEEELRVAKKAMGEKLKKEKSKYDRNPSGDDGKLALQSRDKKLNSRVKRDEIRHDDAHLSAARAEILHSESVGYLEAEGAERTYRFKQAAIKKAVDVNTATKSFDLNLEKTGPYTIDYTRNGRFLALAGASGHVALIDALKNKLSLELDVADKIHDVKFLHNNTMFAVAQKKYAYIYDDNGIELHCLKQHIEPTRLEFLPYHFLLVSAGRTGYLKWQDTSTGELVAEARTKLGSCSVLSHNPYNAVVCAGHASGTVTMWSPTMSEPLVKMLCHRGPLTGLAIDRSGTYMVTTGMDAQMKVWDIRMYKPVHAYYTNRPATSVEVSQRGIIGVGFGSYVQFWSDALSTKAQAPYLRHQFRGSNVRSIKFRPYEDICGVGHEKGFSSLIVPGSGEPNFDAFEANPFQTNKQQREATVHALLDKLQPGMIQLDPTNIGRIDRAPAEIIMKERKAAEEANAAATQKPVKLKKKARGRNKIGKRLKKQHQNIITEERMKIRAAAEEKRRLEKQQREEGRKFTDGALGIFARKKHKM